MAIYGENLPTSYFSEPAASLDPKLFQGRILHTQVRSGVLSLLYGFLEHNYRHPELWAHAWLAGSGVSYQWSSDRHPGDLDCLVGIDFIQLRKANPEFRGLTDVEISDQLNDDFRSGLHPETENWNGYELTFYALTTPDIRQIKPYAAYDLKYDEWTVVPSEQQAAPSNASWDSVVNSDYHMANQAYTRFTAALLEVTNSHMGPQRRNAEAKLTAAGQQSNALYEEIHGGRSQAFSPTGEGYGDFYNYRWQGGKKAGTVEMLREVKRYLDAHRASTEAKIYGSELPSADTLVRRAALYGNK
jgi:hypothetical protein